MLTPLKLNAIDREHLQELYDAAGMHRDQLPYTPQFDALCEGFQDRTFRNAEPEQIYGGLIKAVRTGTSVAALPPTAMTPEQIASIKALASRFAKGGKIMPYTDDFATARTECAKLLGIEVSDRDFWVALLHATGTRRPPPVRKKVVKVEEDDE